ncbi:MAG: alpha/beta fold hydrolase [Chloroflexi bacterium]|nr:alpha/beta fold hydrolase [Chloroflexota bacterium]
MRLSVVLTVCGVLLVCFSLGALWAGDAPLAGARALSFASPEGDTLAATYVPGTQPAGVLLLPGFAGNQAMMRPLAGEFARRGLHIFTFDYSGHGLSDGALRFDNARTDRIARQALAAKEEFKRLSGLSDAQILVVGHSMGARSALQAATMDTQAVAGLILLGTQINLSTNTQAEFFTGTSDTDLAWVQNLGVGNPPVSIALISGQWDDILTPANAQQLFGRLLPAAAEMSTIPVLNTDIEFYGQNADYRALMLPDALFHNYEIYAPSTVGSVMFFADLFLSRSFAASPEAAVPTAENRLVWWLVGVAGFFLALGGGTAYKRPMANSPNGQVQIMVVSHFLWAKLLLWLAALPLSVVLVGALVFLPVPSPVFNLVYVGFIGAYGLLLWALYRFGKMPATRGRLRFGAGEKPGGIWLTIGLTAVMLAATGLYAATGWFNPIPTPTRLFWLALFTPITALGFWIGAHEARMLAALTRRAAPQWALTLIGLFPFFLLALLFGVLGSLSGMIGALQGLIVLALVVLFGRLLSHLQQRAWLVALAQSVLLYWLALPSSALFSG